LRDVLACQGADAVAFAVAAHVAVVAYGLRYDGRGTISLIELLRGRRELALIVEDADVAALSTTGLRRVVRARESAALIGLAVEPVALWRLVAAIAFLLILCSCEGVSRIKACLLAAAVLLNTRRIWHNRKKAR